ncbi:organellar oligopeptidase A, chloroplastic/mitochondrial-like [Portunus trituberculatus]|uniref:organellar oligopeptidase A, chloroplastic/mitochondrial-like n=1 Tax=Portunus trituberculatus TaxID=210409 RepID=UPI001E1CE8AC|nr:organellar oligopeptidase A, chloroplastic/mitochondrial-like [Portunus trituberculatus]
MLKIFLIANLEHKEMEGLSKLLKLSSSLLRFRPKTTYVVLLPENPVDTEDDNPLLRTNSLPEFDQLTPEKCWTGMGKLALEYESGVWAVEERARDPKEPKTFDNIIGELDKLESPFNAAWSTVKTLYTVKNSDMNTNTYLKIHERARKARVHKFQSQPIYEACKESSNLSDTYKSRYQQGPWAVTLQPHVYHSFLEHCPSSDLRRNTYRAYNMRASNHIDQELSNSIHMEDIRSLRGEQATLLGYKDFAHMSMETKMAGSVENVLSMITSLLAKAKTAQDKEIASLQEFAETRGFELQLEAWDVPYWRRKQKRHLFNFDETQLRDYFPFEHVFVSLLELCSELFGISFEEIPDKVPTWHPDVRFFNILDASGDYLASFYLDPFQRPGEKLQTRVDAAWNLVIRSRSDIAKMLPITNLVFNFTPPASEDQSALLTFSEVTLLFQKFGSALQHLLTTVPYTECSGMTNIEWDAVEVCSNFMQNWLQEPAVLQRISQHYESGLPLSGSSIKELLASQNHMAGYDLCSELYLAHLDMELHTRKNYWLDIARELWPSYRPFTLDKYDAHLCSNTAIMADVWAAAYYSHLWSRMVAADVFQAFREPQETDGELGERFRSTFLSLGGGCHPSEVFRRFRGRDPSPDALHVLCGISPQAT